MTAYLGRKEPDSLKKGKQSTIHLNPCQGHMSIWSAIGYPNSSLYQALFILILINSILSTRSSIQRSGFLQQQQQTTNLKRRKNNKKLQLQQLNGSHMQKF
jgi:hypothetical protein